MPPQASKLDAALQEAIQHHQAGRLDEAERMCDRFALLHLGRLMHEGTLGELQALTGLATLSEMLLAGMARAASPEAAAA